MPQQLLGQCSNGGLGDAPGALGQRRQQAERLCGQRQREDAVAAGQHQRSGRGVADGMQRLRLLRREFRNDARDRPLDRFQGVHGIAQPLTLAYRHPDRLAGPGLRLERKVKGLRLVQQPVFEQPFQHGPQPRR